jgi:uncharacterized protein (TIGR00661 family)
VRILYGVVGEGMGHATRSRVVIEHLLDRGHDVLVAVSGRAFGFLEGALAGRERASVLEIVGLTLSYDENAVDKSRTVLDNLAAAPRALRRNLAAWKEIVTQFEPEAVFTDFDSFTYLLGRAHRLPVVSIDNMQVLDRCVHEDHVTDGRSASFRLAKATVKARLPGAYHYLVSSFFFPPVRKQRTTLVPPILRPEILAARREPGEHVLVYQTAGTSTTLLPTLKRLRHRFRVYGMRREGVEDNVELRPFSQTGFVDDLRTARAVVAGGGYSLMGEAVHLRVPMLCVPLEGQFEQQLNARYLATLGYGVFADELTEEGLRTFLEGLGAHDRALEEYTPRDNAILLACVDELVERIAGGEPPPEGLRTEALGTYVDG